MRKSRDSLRRALDDLDDDSVDDAAPCPDCGGLPAGADARMGVTAEFVTFECSCDDEAPAGVVVIGR